MTVCVDNLKPCLRNAKWRYDKVCHLLADSEEELVEFAARIGLNPSWIQRGKLLHFDLTEGKRKAAVAAGAKEVDDRFIAKRLMEVRHGVRTAFRGQNG